MDRDLASTRDREREGKKVSFNEGEREMLLDRERYG